MAAANTDLLRKKKSLFSTTLSSGISAVDTSMTLASTSGLPTDTAITLTIDRVDANGVSTPSARERVTGVVSGSNVTNLVRGEDGDGGTGKVHNAGAVIEDIWDAETWNDAITVLMATHDQATGRIKNETAYAADAGANDTYAITVTPAISAYAAGQVFQFKANTANTGACSLNVNTKGAITIKKWYNQDLADNDIAAGQIVSVIYDGSNFQMLSPVSNTVDKNTAQTMTNKTLTSPILGGTPVLDATSSIPFYNDNMARQAIINGNFDVWQRTTSVTPADAANTFAADHWFDSPNKDGGTLPTLTRSRVALTSGLIPNAFYMSQLATNGAGSSLGVNSNHYYSQKIEHGTRFLCGNGKKVTFSIYAASSIANKRMAVSIIQNYGTGGTPTSQEPIITSVPITLTSDLTKYTFTFTTNTLTGKTFGTNNDDYLQVLVHFVWGTTFGNAYVYPSITAETYVGSGNIYLAQASFCTGDVSLLFQPKTFNEELKDCMRFYQKSYLYSVAPGTATTGGNTIFGVGTATTGPLYTTVYLKVPMRATPTVHTYDSSGNIDKCYRGGANKACSVDAGYACEKSFMVNASDATSATYFEFQHTAEAEL